MDKWSLFDSSMSSISFTFLALCATPLQSKLYHIFPMTKFWSLSVFLYIYIMWSLPKHLTGLFLFRQLIILQIEHNFVITWTCWRLLYHFTVTSISAVFGLGTCSQSLIVNMFYFQSLVSTICVDQRAWSECWPFPDWRAFYCFLIFNCFASLQTECSTADVIVYV